MKDSRKRIAGEDRVPVPDTRWHLRLHYYAAMLSAPVLAAALAAAAAYTMDHLESLPHLLTQIAVWLAIVNAAGALVIFGPVDRSLRGATVARPVLERRIRALPRLSGLWLFALAAAAMLGHATALSGSWSALAGEQPRVLVGILANIAVFAAYVGLIVYFLTFDYEVRLRRRLWQQGVAIPPRQGNFMRRLIAGLLAVAAAPVLIPLSGQWVQPADADMAMAMAINADRYVKHMQMTLQMDLLAALFFAALLIFLMARGFSRPVGILLKAMQRVDEGDLASKSPVVSDDEFGLLTQQLNRMLDGLRERDRIRRVF